MQGEDDEKNDWDWRKSQCLQILAIASLLILMAMEIK
jgi:hypothetical protein